MVPTAHISKQAKEGWSVHSVERYVWCGGVVIPAGARLVVLCVVRTCRTWRPSRVATSCWASLVCTHAAVGSASIRAVLHRMEHMVVCARCEWSCRTLVLTGDAPTKSASLDCSLACLFLFSEFSVELPDTHARADFEQEMSRNVPIRHGGRGADVNNNNNNNNNTQQQDSSLEPFLEPFFLPGAVQWNIGQSAFVPEIDIRGNVHPANQHCCVLRHAFLQRTRKPSRWIWKWPACPKRASKSNASTTCCRFRARRNMRCDSARIRRLSMLQC